MRAKKKSKNASMATERNRQPIFFYVERKLEKKCIILNQRSESTRQNRHHSAVNRSNESQKRYKTNEIFSTHVFVGRKRDIKKMKRKRYQRTKMKSNWNTECVLRR